MITLQKEIADKIAHDWIELWNHASVPVYLEQYTDDAVLVSSVALRLFPESNGRIIGKDVLLNYWETVRIHFPNFTFKINRTEFYENKVVIYYETKDSLTKAIAILSLNDDYKIKKIEVSYV